MEVTTSNMMLLGALLPFLAPKNRYPLGLYIKLKELLTLSYIHNTSSFFKAAPRTINNINDLLSYMEAYMEPNEKASIDNISELLEIIEILKNI